MIYFITIWIVCGILTYGIAFAYLQREYELIADKCLKEDVVGALCMGALGIIGLIVILLTTDFAKHGLLFIKHKKMDKMDKKEENVEYIKVSDVVYCDDCGVVMKKGSEQEVKNNGWWGKTVSHYCKQCKKPYKEVIFVGDGIHYYSECEVDINGKPIKK